MKTLSGEYNQAIVYTDNIDEITKKQVTALLNQKSSENSSIRIMPDCHAGAGCVIGTTMTITDKAIPNLVGVDIGCGVLVIKLNQKDIDLPKLDKIIHDNIPSSFDVRDEKHINASKIDLSLLKCKIKQIDRLYLSIGTLGGGNHFIEIDEDDDKNKYLIIHTGSRNLGTQVASYYQNKAFEDPINKIIKNAIEQLKSENREQEIENFIKDIRVNNPPIPKNMAYVKGQNFNDYINDMKISQEYAVLNRRTIADIILENMGFEEIESFETIHNYIDMRTENYNGNYMLRKGAVSALKDEILIIPINMKDGCIIAKGKENIDYNKSAPHGAGRLMSRSEAVKKLKIEEYEETMKNIYSTSVNKATLDEASMAYKPMKAILSHIDDTVEIVAKIKPIYNFKSADEVVNYKDRRKSKK